MAIHAFYLGVAAFNCGAQGVAVFIALGTFAPTVFTTTLSIFSLSISFPLFFSLSLSLSLSLSYSFTQ